VEEGRRDAAPGGLDRAVRGPGDFRMTLQTFAQSPAEIA
jgi:hypothetical protein